MDEPRNPSAESVDAKSTEVVTERSGTPAFAGSPRVNRTLSGFFWVVLYLLVLFVPILLMLVPPVPSGRRFWVEFSVALGFVGLTQIAVQFVLIARFKRVTAPYGIDIILHYHRQIALLAVALILVHPVVIVVENPSRLTLLNPLGGHRASRAGWVSVLALLAIVITSLYRQRLGLEYERWRFTHLLLAVTAVVFAQVHVSLAGLYTNTAWKHAIWIITAAIMVGLVLYLRVVKPAWQRGYGWRVAEVRPEGGATHALVLEPLAPGGLRFEPGQFAWIKLAGSPFTLEEHPFSFSSSAERPEHIEFGIRSLGDFTSRIGQIPVGTPAYLDGPHGAFSIDRYPAVAYVFIAGGVGITPFMSMLRTMADRRDPRPVLLIYGERTLESIPYRSLLEELRGTLNLQIAYVLQNPPADWTGERGFVSAEVLERWIPRDRIEREFFICGPPVMMMAVQQALISRGVPETHIQVERFNLA